MSENLSSTFPYNSSSSTDGLPNSTDEDCILADSNAEKVVMVLAYFIILLVSLVGNSLVILVFYKNKQLRRSINYYVLNMAVSDLFTPLTIMPVNIVHIISGSPAFMVDTPLVLGKILCKLCYFLPDVSLMVSIQSLLLISVDRFIAVVFPLQMKLISSKVRFICISCTWIVAIAVHAPYFYTFKLIPDGNSYKCLKRWGANHDKIHSRYVTAVFITFYLVPIFVLVVLYCTIAWSLKRRHKRRKSMCTSYRSGSHQVSIRLSVAILTAYAFCIGPHSVYVFIRTFMWHWRVPPICAFKTVIPFVSRFMAFSWSAINPCICFTFNKNYQNGLKGIITARSGATNLRTTTGTTTLRKRATSSGTERICLRVIEKEEEEDEKQDEQKEGQEELQKEGEEDYQEITEVRTERRSDEEEVLKKEWEEEGQI